MTPTRALIEAAEMMADTYLIAPEDVVEKLRAAISSAKAAEEGVESRWVVEYSLGKLAWEPDIYGYDDKQAAAERLEECFAYIQPTRLVQLDTYSTVIEVREKEEL